MAGEKRKCGRLVVISGPSGVGKSTICHRLCKAVGGEFSVSVTTRKARPGETNARDYHYITPEEFTQLRDTGGLLEWAEVYGNKYGTPAEPVELATRNGKTIILEIDIQGCIQVRKKRPDVIAVFVLPPSSDEQKRRIEGRKTDAESVIAERLSKADGEVRYAIESGCYDEFIINDDLDKTVERIAALCAKEQ